MVLLHYMPERSGNKTRRNRYMYHHCPQVMIRAQRRERTGLTVISDRTDVFVLLLHFHHEVDKNCTMTESPTKGKISTDIGITMKKHADIITEIFPVYDLSGCDTVACCYGLGERNSSESVKGWITFIDTTWNGWDIHLLNLSCNRQPVHVVMLWTQFKQRYVWNMALECRERLIINSTETVRSCPKKRGIAENVKRFHIPSYFLPFIRSSIAILQNLIRN
jgi:hypothetical protein